MSYVLVPKNQRLQPLTLNALTWWFILDRAHPQFPLAVHKDRLPHLVRLKERTGFRITQREASLMAQFVQQNSAQLQSKWPIVDQFVPWATKSRGFSIN